MSNYNMCDFCKNTFAECEAKGVVYGDGIGNDNVVKCNSYVERDKTILQVINDIIAEANIVKAEDNSSIDALLEYLYLIKNHYTEKENKDDD